MTGQLSIIGTVPVGVSFGGFTVVTIAAGASLTIEDVYTYDVPGTRFVVDGTLVARHLRIVNLEGNIATVAVHPTGVAILDDSMLIEVYGGSTTPLVNEGTALVRNSVLMGDGTGVNTLGSGITTTASSILTHCEGTAPTSLGYNNATDSSCALVGPGDIENLPPVFTAHLDQGPWYDLPADSPLVDAIPVGVNGCGDDLTRDMMGNPRPVDGNGDGVVACDIGPLEQPTPL